MTHPAQTRFIFSDFGIAVTEGAYSGCKADGTTLTIKADGIHMVSGKSQNGRIVFIRALL